MTKRVQEAVEGVFNLYAKGILADEDHVTGALVYSLAEKLDGLQVGDVRVRAFTFSRGQEARTGADLGVALSADLRGVKLTKYMLMQAKRCECLPGKNYELSDGNIEGKLLDQCRKMLSVARSSYVLVYTRSELCGFLAYRAADVLGFDGASDARGSVGSISCAKLSSLWAIPLPELFDDLLKCKMGDVMLDKPFFREEELSNLPLILEERGYSARRWVAISVRESKE
ncbi:hypothetical protein [Infirmifilum sp. SLHALR2]